MFHLEFGALSPLPAAALSKHTPHDKFVARLAQMTLPTKHALTHRRRSGESARTATP